MTTPPANLKAIGSFLKLAKEYDKRDPTIAYFCRMYAVQKGIKLDSKTAESKTFLFSLMDQLETTKKVLVSQGDEAMTNDVVAQAHLETKTIDLFTWADTEDRGGVFNKNITKAFYSTSLLFEVLTQFGEQNDECKVMQKYSKWKATYLHKCAQSGETPQPGPQGSGFEDDLGGINASLPSIPGESTYDDPSTFTSGAGPSSSGAGPSSSSGGSSSTYPGTGPSTSSDVGQFPDLPSVPNTTYTPPPQPPQQQPQQPPQPQPPPPQQQPPYQPPTSGGVKAVHEIDTQQVEKLCKYAISALQYEDVNAAVENLRKALNMMTR